MTLTVIIATVTAAATENSGYIMPVPGSVTSYLSLLPNVVFDIIASDAFRNEVAVSRMFHWF